MVSIDGKVVREGLEAVKRYNEMRGELRDLGFEVKEKGYELSSPWDSSHRIY
jgi:hypothetical protein